MHGILLTLAIGLSGSAPAKTDAVASRAEAIIATVLDNHIDPPTRQQLILAGTRAVYRAAKKPMPQKTSRRVSQITDRKTLRRHLAELRKQIEWKKFLDDAFVNGLVASLPGGGRLISAEETRVLGQLNRNRYVGTGVVIGVNKQAKRPWFPKVFYKGPAWKAGAKHGDMIISINGESSEKMTVQRVVKLLRGEVDSKVVVQVRQPNSKKTRTLKITRGVAFIPTVDGYKQLSEAKWQYRIDKATQLAYVRINRIGSSTLHELRQAERAMQGKPVRGLVLDLRYGGGTLHDIVMIADALLPKGPIGRVRTGDKVKKYESTRGDLFAKLPMAVLVDRATSSGREFLTAALQDRKRAVVVGEPTPGDGNVRSYLTISGSNERMLLATGELQRINGRSLRATGRPLWNNSVQIRSGAVVPDHIVIVNPKLRGRLYRTYSHATPGLRKAADDPIIAKAVEVLNTKLNRVGAKAKKPKAEG